VRLDRGLELACARNCRRWSIASVTSSPSRGARTLCTSSTIRPLRSLITLRLPGLPAKPLLGGELDALLALVLDAGEPDHVRHHFARGIEAPELALLEHARDPQRHHLRRLVGRNLALEEGELAILSVNFLAQLLQVIRARARARAPGLVDVEVLGLTQIDSTGEEIASSWPLRSFTGPREAAISITRP
jgi:hypothetical protein